MCSQILPTRLVHSPPVSWNLFFGCLCMSITTSSIINHKNLYSRFLFKQTNKQNSKRVLPKKVLHKFSFSFCCERLPMIWLNKWLNLCIQPIWANAKKDYFYDVQMLKNRNLRGFWTVICSVKWCVHQPSIYK